MKAKLFTVLSLLLLCQSLTSLQAAECVDVRDRGKVSLQQLQCTPITTNDLLETICYDNKEAYLLLNVAGQYFEYCGVKQQLVDELMKAPKKSLHVNTHIAIGIYDCTIFQPPAYAGQCK